MSDKNIVLIGFMASGKSMVSNCLGQKLQKEVFSTDAVIEEYEHRSIADIFAQSGEAYFRTLEKRVVEEASEKQGIIIDCGGGVVLDPENMKALSSSGVLIHLSASPEFIYSIVKGQTDRPLLNVEDPLAEITKRLADRLPLYEQADMKVISEYREVEDIAKEIMETVKL